MSGSWRSGTPAICMWPTRPVGRYWRIFIATSPSTIWQWYRSICTFRFGAPTSCTMRCASSCRFSTKPGMSRVLIGSISTSLPALAACLRRPSEVGQVGGQQLGALDPHGREAGHHVHARALQRLRVLQRRVDRTAELVFAAGQRGHAALAALPVAGRPVEQHLLQTVLGQARAERLRLVRVGKQVLHRLEAVGRRGGKAVEEFVLRIEHAQVGGEAGHGGSRMDGEDAAYQRAPKCARNSSICAAVSGAARASAATAARSLRVLRAPRWPRRATVPHHRAEPLEHHRADRRAGRARGADALRHRIGHRGVARPVVGNQRHVADLHHEVRRDRRHDVIGVPHAGQASARPGAWRACGSRSARRGRRRRCGGAAPASSMRDRRRSARLASFDLGQPRGVERAQAGIGGRDQKAADRCAR